MVNTKSWFIKNIFIFSIGFVIYKGKCYDKIYITNIFSDDSTWSRVPKLEYI